MNGDAESPAGEAGLN